MLKLYLFYMFSIFMSPNIYYFLSGDKSLFIGASEMLMPVLVAVNTVYMMFNRTDRYPMDKEASFIIIAMTILFVWGSAMLVFTPYIYNSTFTFLLKYALNIILLYQFSKIFPNLLKGEKQNQLLRKYIMISFAGVAVVSLLEIFYPDLVHTIYTYDYESSISVWLGQYRLAGTAGGPNTYVMLIYTLIALILAQYNRNHRTLFKVLSILAIIYLINIAILTASRGGLLAIATQLLIFFSISFFRPRNTNVKIITICLGGIVFVFALKILFLIQDILMEYYFDLGKTYSIYYMNFMASTKYPEFFSSLPPALVERMYIAQQGLQAFSDFPILKKFTGAGLNASSNLIIKFSNIDLTSFHNAFVQYLFCTGIPGFLLYLTIVKRTYTYLSKRTESFFALSTYYMFIGFMMHSLFEANFLWNFKSMQIFVFFVSLAFTERFRQPGLEGAKVRGAAV